MEGDQRLAAQAEQLRKQLELDRLLTAPHPSYEDRPGDNELSSYGREGESASSLLYWTCGIVGFLGLNATAFAAYTLVYPLLEGFKGKSAEVAEAQQTVRDADKNPLEYLLFGRQIAAQRYLDSAKE